MNYRREIDGLRALAVLPVIFFHAGFQAFSGGFAGVDVFFVISGYLITSLILQQIDSGTFTLASFYERRARRILPALFLVMIACLPFAWLWMLPNEIKAFTKSLIATVLFASNIFFYGESGYFDTAAELKPLLHTWSLAVEEQYYLLFPLLFLPMVWRLGKRRVFLIVASVGLSSLALATWGSLNMPAASFYLLPTRLWELLLGATIAFVASRRHGPGILQESAMPAVRQLASLAGLALITFAVVAFDRSTPYPGLYALVPTTGTALVILFATPRTLVGSALSSRFLVSIGLISYSAYLWHQPLFAFARLRSVQPPSAQILLLLAAVSLLIAYFSWRYIERPFRDRTRFSRSTIFLSSAIISGLLIVVPVGLVYFASKPHYLYQHLPRDYFAHTWIEYDKFGADKELCYSGSASICKVNVSSSFKNRFLLLGDSHSGDFTKVYKTFLTANSMNGSQMSVSGCAFLNSQLSNRDGECGKARGKLKLLASESAFDEYIIVGAFFDHTHNLSAESRHADIESFVSLVTNMLDSGAKVHFFEPRFTWTVNPVKAASLNAMSESRIVEASGENALDWEIAISRLSQDKRFRVFDQNEALVSAGCGKRNCFDGHTREMYPLFRDSNHLTSIGAQVVFEEFADTLQ
jgi:peptidoglycan/LPS O-acetylase OafA/YrhL